MPKISEEKKEARRRQILEAAWRCFQREGLHVTSMQDIIGESGLSAGAVYLYFRTKEELILEAVTSSLGGLADRIAPVLARNPLPAPEELVFELVSIVGAFSQRDGYDLRRIALLGWSEAQRSETLRSRMRDFYAMFSSRLETVVLAWQRSGAVTTGDPAAMAATLQAMIMGYVAQSALLESVSPDMMRDGLSGLRQPRSAPPKA